jgi:hypothetical protein
VTELEGTEAMLGPWALCAITVKVYAVPLVSPVTTAEVAEGPRGAVVPPGGDEVTVKFKMGVPPVLAGGAQLTVALALPAVAETLVGWPGTVTVAPVLVSKKVAGVRVPGGGGGEVATTEKVPGEEAGALGVRRLAVAVPLELVATVVTLVPPVLNVPLDPVAGAVNVTIVPATRTGLPAASSTVAPRCLGNGVPIALVWPPPPLTTSCVAGPAATIVKPGLLCTWVVSIEVLTPIV